MKGIDMTAFEQWYSQNKDMITNMKTREEVAFYTWTNKPKAITKPKVTSTQDFETFWSMYPNKTNKQGALIAWNKTKPPIIDIVAALDWQTKTDQWKSENGKYIPHGSTYLNQCRYKDVPAVVVNTSETYVDMNGIRRTR